MERPPSTCKPVLRQEATIWTGYSQLPLTEILLFFLTIIFLTVFHFDWQNKKMY